MNTNENIVAIYCRLSKEDVNSGENESESIQNQKSILTSYSVNNNWDIYKIYCDEDYTGSDNNRPEWKQMLKDAENKKFNIILFKTQSRFSGDMEMVERYIHGVFLEWGVRFIGLVDNADTDVKGNKKSRQINSLINEWYLEDLSENIKSVFKNKMQNGEYLGTYPPYGYEKDTKIKNHLVIDKESSEIVKMIFNWSIEGYGAAKIARMLNDKNIPNPRKLQEIKGLKKIKMYDDNENGKWITTSIGDILHNQVYCGDVVQNKKNKLSYKIKKIVNVPKEDCIIIKNTHEAIIDRETFDYVQKNLTSKRKSTGTGKVHILSGKVFCYYCDKPMQKNHGTSKNTKDIGYLRCRDKYSYSMKNKCPTPNIRIDKVLEYIKLELLEKLKNYTKTKDLSILFLNKNSIKKQTICLQDINRIEKDIEKYEKTIKSLYVDKVNQIITEEQFIQFNKDFSEKIIQCKSKITTINKELQELKIESEKSKQTERCIDEFIKTNTLTKHIINTIITRITYGELKDENEGFILKINWSWD